MIAVFNPVVLISGTIFLGFDPHGVFQPAGFAGALVTAWLLFIAYVAVLVAIATLLRSNGAAIATNICLVSIFPTLLQAPDFLFGRIGLKIFPVWIGEKLSSVTSLPLPSGAVMAGIFIAILYVIAAGAVGIEVLIRLSFRCVPPCERGDNVMDFLHRSQPTFLQAQLTQRMRRSIAVADSFPSPAILLIAVSRPLIPVVLNPHSLPVFLTVRFIGEPATARVTARAL